jgi:hypothetical protein
MIQELSKELVCVLVRSGIEIWVEKDRADILIKMLQNKDCPQFIEYENQIINKADISGIFNSKTMEEKTRRKNGQWKCENGIWHDKFEKCDSEQEFFNQLKAKNYGKS